MHILGLTGSIAMGKSTAARLLRRVLRVPVHDADAAVHRLMGRGGRAVPAIEAAFPGVTGDGRVDRAALGRMVFGDVAALARLEAILHPLVRAEERHFLKRCMRARARLAVLDIPLLFETGAERRCDLVCVVTAPLFVQEQRVLARPGMTRARLAQVRARQMPEPEKRKRADAIAQTGRGRAWTLRALERAVRLTLERPASHWPPTGF